MSQIKALILHTSKWYDDYKGRILLERNPKFSGFDHFTFFKLKSILKGLCTHIESCKCFIVNNL